jgi:type II secretory pathway component GspD/PulD (secretin)
MRSTRFWLGVFVALGGCLSLAPLARAQSPSEECCEVPGVGPAAALRLVGKKAPAAEQGKQPSSTAYSHKCVHIPAGEAMRLLARLLGGRGQEGSKAGRFTLAADDRTNTLHMTGPADRMALAREFLAKIDVGLPGQSPLVLGPPLLRSYPVPMGQAEALAKLFQTIHQGSPQVQVVALGNNRLLVWASPEAQITIARHLEGAIPSPPVTEVIPLTISDATRMAEFLKAAFKPTVGQPPGPSIEADEAGNAIIVRGSREQIREVRDALRAGGVDPDDHPGARAKTMRVITLPEGNAADLASLLKEMFGKIRANPVRIVIPGQKEAKPAKPAKPAKERAKLPGKATMPLTITLVGNKLILTSDDPEALAVAQELVRLATRSGGGDLQVIRLRHATAAAVAQTLDEVFNGPRVGDAKLPPGLKGPARRTDRVRIIADPASNALLVRATPLDLMTIRRLLEQELDTVDTEPQLRPWIVGPFKHAKASELAKVLEGVYRPAAPARAQPSVSFSVDERANVLVLRCSQPLYEEIQRLAKLLDDMHRQAK